MADDSGAEHGFDPVAQSLAIGYTREQIGRVPADAVQGAGCANPVPFADLQPGEVVLDVGCGGGMDVLLAADAVGPEGCVIGVDAESEALALARRNADDAGLANVALRRGEIVDLPVDDASVDVVLSNCSVNYADDLQRAFAEMRRCLRAGGRVVVADLVLTERFDADRRRRAPDPWREWLAEAALRGQYLSGLRATFDDVTVVQERPFNLAQTDSTLSWCVVSLVVRATP